MEFYEKLIILLLYSILCCLVVFFRQYFLLRIIAFSSFVAEYKLNLSFFSMKRPFTILFALLASTGMFAQNIVQAHFNGSTGTPIFLKFNPNIAVALNQEPQLSKYNHIDWNRDGDFNDAGEEVDKGSSSSSANLTSTFTVPSTASLGTTRMRISMKYNVYQTPCKTFSYSEIEDYALVIGNAFAFANNTLTEGEKLEDKGQVNGLNVYPKSFGSELNINLPFESENLSYQVINMQGQIVKHNNISSNKNRINTSDLPRGIYTVRFFDGQKTISKKIIKY